MFFVPQVQPPDVDLVIHLLVRKLITFGRNGRERRDHTDAWNRPWCSSGSGYSPQTREPSARRREHDIATVRSPSRRPIYPGVVERQSLGSATGNGHDIEVFHHTRSNPSDESYSRAVGRESWTIVEVLTSRRGKATYGGIAEPKQGNPGMCLV